MNLETRPRHPNRRVPGSWRNVQILPERSKSGAVAGRMWRRCGEVTFCKLKIVDFIKLSESAVRKIYVFLYQISRYRRQPWRASVSRAREIHSRKVITNKAFFRRPMGGCERGAAAVALMLRRWVCARTMCPRSPLAAGAGSLGGVRTLRRWCRGAPAVARMQGGGGGGRSWGGVLRSDTDEAVRVAALIFRAHPNKHFIC